ncbi:MAG: hypothetical protein M5U14_01315 [Acidimicrobiia bacterium]|nr:hypothetical protein [Acidimicrobiia bacterium]
MALTRAERVLHLSWARRRTVGLRETSRTRSPLLDDLPLDARPGPAEEVPRRRSPGRASPAPASSSPRPGHPTPPTRRCSTPS